MDEKLEVLLTRGGDIWIEGFGDYSKVEIIRTKTISHTIKGEKGPKTDVIKKEIISRVIAEAVPDDDKKYGFIISGNDYETLSIKYYEISPKKTRTIKLPKPITIDPDMENSRDNTTHVLRSIFSGSTGEGLEYKDETPEQYVFFNTRIQNLLVGDAMASDTSVSYVLSPDPNNKLKYEIDPDTRELKYREIINNSQGMFCRDDFGIDYIVPKQKFVSLEFEDTNYKILDDLKIMRGLPDKNGNYVEPADDESMTSRWSFLRFKEAIKAVAHSANAYRNILTPDIIRWLDNINVNYDKSIFEWDNDLINKILESVRIKDNKIKRRFGNLTIDFHSEAVTDDMLSHDFSGLTAIFNIQDTSDIDRIVISNYEGVVDLFRREPTKKTVFINGKNQEIEEYKLLDNILYSYNLKFNEIYNIKFYYNKENTKNFTQDCYELIIETPASNPNIIFTPYKILGDHNGFVEPAANKSPLTRKKQKLLTSTDKIRDTEYKWFSKIEVQPLIKDKVTDYNNIITKTDNNMVRYNKNKDKFIQTGAFYPEAYTDNKSVKFSVILDIKHNNIEQANPTNSNIGPGTTTIKYTFDYKYLKFTEKTFENAEVLE